MVREEFHLVTQCPSCGVPCEMWPNSLPHPDYQAENSSQAEVTTLLQMECETCDCVFEVAVTSHLSGWTAHVSDNPSHSVSVDHLDHGDDDWLEDLEPEPHPIGNYNTAVAEWRRFLRDLGDEGFSGINRMLLVQLFSAFEAYLSDAVISLVHRNDGVLNAIVAWHEELKDEKVSLLAVAKNPNLVRDILIAKLRRTQFHRFEHVNGMLRASLNHHLLPSRKEDRDFILQSVKFRHACVHKNGNDDDGKPIEGITFDYLRRLEAIFTAMAEKLDDVIYDLENPPDLNEPDVPFFDETGFESH